MQKKILIVDDNIELLEMAREVVKAAGFKVAVASTGPDGLAKARSFKPDLLILDLVLPEMDGFAICEALRRDRETSTLPVIMLTGLTSEFTRYAGLECGANEYVKKPVTADELLSKIGYWLGLSGPVDAVADACNRDSACEKSNAPLVDVPLRPGGRKIRT